MRTEFLSSSLVIIGGFVFWSPRAISVLYKWTTGWAGLILRCEVLWMHRPQAPEFPAKLLEWNAKMSGSQFGSLCAHFIKVRKGSISKRPKWDCWPIRGFSAAHCFNTNFWEIFCYSWTQWDFCFYEQNCPKLRRPGHNWYWGPPI